MASLNCHFRRNTSLNPNIPTSTYSSILRFSWTRTVRVKKRGLDWLTSSGLTPIDGEQQQQWETAGKGEAHCSNLLFLPPRLFLKVSTFHLPMHLLVSTAAVPLQAMLPFYPDQNARLLVVVTMLKIWSVEKTRGHRYVSAPTLNIFQWKEISRCIFE